MLVQTSIKHPATSDQYPVTSIEHPAYCQFNSDVQCGHFIALMGIDDIQYGHSFVSGAAGGGSLLNLFTCFIIINIQNATIRKLMIVLIKRP